MAQNADENKVEFEPARSPEGTNKKGIVQLAARLHGSEFVNRLTIVAYRTQTTQNNLSQNGRDDLNYPDSDQWGL